jgi:putative transposase
MQKHSYPTDVTDEQWAKLGVLLPARQKYGRPPVDRRMIINALLYLARAGCSWRLLPRDFGHWETVCGYFRRWCKNGLLERINDVLRSDIRRSVGKRSQPTAAILDSQTVRSADHAGERGYDGAKHTKGRKRHILVDTLGLLLAVCVTPANVGERDGARGFLSKAIQSFGWLRCIWADQGYDGQSFASWIASHRKTGTLRLEIVSRIFSRGFRLLPRRWIVERTFGWFVKNRRLVRDYEITTSSAEGWIYVSMIGLMLRRF